MGHWREGRVEIANTNQTSCSGAAPVALGGSVKTLEFFHVFILGILQISNGGGVLLAQHKLNASSKDIEIVELLNFRKGPTVGRHAS